MISRRRFLAGLVAAPIAAACGGDDDDAPTTTEATTTSTTAPATTTTAAPPPVQPLTGIVHTGDPAILARPALVVKIDNIDTSRETARPQSGINQADVVFEERTEGGITRFAAVFHSTDADPVVPVRSARYTDLDIISMLNRPLFAYSGASVDVTNAVHAANLVPLGHGDIGNDYYYRVGDRRAPHNLATSTPLLYSLTPAGSLPPPQLFTYRALGTPPVNGHPSGGVHLEWGGSAQSPVQYLYDASQGGWVRIMNGTPHLDAFGQVVVVPNLIVQHIDYDGTQGILTGGGTAWVFTGDQVVEGTWYRPDPALPAAYLDATNAPIALSPGRTWVALPPNGMASLL